MPLTDFDFVNMTDDGEGGFLVWAKDAETGAPVEVKLTKAYLERLKARIEPN